MRRRKAKGKKGKGRGGGLCLWLYKKHRITKAKYESCVKKAARRHRGHRRRKRSSWF